MRYVILYHPKSGSSVKEEVEADGWSVKDQLVRFWVEEGMDIVETHVYHVGCIVRFYRIPKETA
jgi:hypothetical protein